MPKLQIGQTVRTLRKRKNLTQAQLCGDYITRNLLSQIESDKVSPSLDTLCYLAQRLDVAPGDLLSGDGAAALPDNAQTEKIKEAFEEGRWLDAVTAFEEKPAGFEQMRPYYYLACMNLASEYFRAGSLLSARQYASRVDAEGAGPYLYENARVILRFCEEITEEKTKPMDSRSDGALPYLFCLMQSFAPQSGEIARGCDLFRSGFYAQAEQVLTDCLLNKELSSDPILRIFLLTLLESGAVRMGNFEAAYAYLSEKNKLRCEYRK